MNILDGGAEKFLWPPSGGRITVLNITFQNFFQKVNENFERRRTLGIFEKLVDESIIHLYDCIQRNNYFCTLTNYISR